MVSDSIIQRPKCSVEECERKVDSRNFCKRHYERWRIKGSPGNSKIVYQRKHSFRDTKEIITFLKLHSYVNGNGCYIWKGKHDYKNYGLLKIEGKWKRVHRVSAKIFLNYKFSKEKLVCHHCDNPSCWNPTHLFIGTQKDNIQDCVKKGRNFLPKGERCGTSKLKNKEVIELHPKEIARKFEVHFNTILKICRRESWTHI